MLVEMYNLEANLFYVTIYLNRTHNIIKLQRKGKRERD